MLVKIKYCEIKYVGTSGMSTVLGKATLNNVKKVRFEQSLITESPSQPKAPNTIMKHPAKKHAK